MNDNIDCDTFDEFDAAYDRRKRKREIFLRIMELSESIGSKIDEIVSDIDLFNEYRRTESFRDL